MPVGLFQHLCQKNKVTGEEKKTQKINQPSLQEMIPQTRPRVSQKVMDRTSHGKFFLMRQRRHRKKLKETYQPCLIGFCIAIGTTLSRKKALPSKNTKKESL